MDGPEIRWEYYPLVAAHPTTRAFVERLSLKGKRPKTIDAYARAIEDLLNYFAGKDPCLVLEADEADLDGYIAHLKRRAPKKRRNGKREEDDCTSLKRAGVSLDDIALFAGHRSTESTRL